MENSLKIAEWDRQVFGVARARSHNNLSWGTAIFQYRHARLSARTNSYRVYLILPKL